MQSLTRKSFWTNMFGVQRFRFTFEELFQLYSVLQKNTVVTESNKALVVETIRSLAEFMIWGDQNEPRVFEFFLENNVMIYLHRVLLQRSNRSGDVAKQVLQTLSIIIQNVRSETAIFFLFSNNHVNNIVNLEFDFEDEEVLGYYISFLKTISLKLNTGTVQFFLDNTASDTQFPLYTQAIKFAHHREGMVRAAVRTLTLSVYSVDDNGIQQFVTSDAVQPYFSDMAWYAAEQIQILDKRLASSESCTPQALASLDSQLAEVEDILAYFSDVLCTGSKTLAHLVARALWSILVSPVLFSPLLEWGGPQDTGTYHLGTDVNTRMPSPGTTPRHRPVLKIGRSLSAGLEHSSVPHVRAVCAMLALERIFVLLSYKPLLHQCLLALLYDAKALAGGAAPREWPHTRASQDGLAAPTGPTTPSGHGAEEGGPPASLATALAPAGGDTTPQGPTCREVLLEMVSGGDMASGYAAVRLLVAVLQNRSLAPELLLALRLLPRSRRPELAPAPRGTVCRACRYAQHARQLSAAAAEAAARTASESGAGPGPKGPAQWTGAYWPQLAGADSVGEHMGLAPLKGAPSEDLLAPLEQLALEPEADSGAGFGAELRPSSARQSTAGERAPNGESAVKEVDGGEATGVDDTLEERERGADVSSQRGSADKHEGGASLAGGVKAGGAEPVAGEFETRGAHGASSRSRLEAAPCPWHGDDAAEGGDPEVLHVLFRALQRKAFPSLGLWHVGWLLHQLLPLAPPSPGTHLRTESTTELSGERGGTFPGSALAGGLVAGDMPGPAQRSGCVLSGWQADTLSAQVAECRTALLDELSGMWCEALFPIIAIEWDSARESLLRPVLRASSEALLAGPHCYPLAQPRAGPPSASPNGGGGAAAQRGEASLSSSALAALRSFVAVSRSVAFTQIAELLQVGVVARRAPVPRVAESDLRHNEVQEGCQVELVPGSAVPCVVSFAQGQERRVYFAVAGLSLRKGGVETSSGDSSSGASGLLRCLPVAVLADPAPTRLNAGKVLSVAPLLGADPTLDRAVPKWLHVHVRPSLRGLLRVIKGAGPKKGGLIQLMRQLADGHWVLAFPDADRAMSAKMLVQQHAAKLRALYCEVLNPMIMPTDTETLAEDQQGLVAGATEEGR